METESVPGENTGPSNRFYSLILKKNRHFYLLRILDASHPFQPGTQGPLWSGLSLPIHSGHAGEELTARWLMHVQVKRKCFTQQLLLATATFQPSLACTVSCLDL